MALILTRKVGEKVRVDDCEIEVRRIRGNTAVLAFTAPPDIKILRSEVAERDRVTA